MKPKPNLVIRVWRFKDAPEHYKRLSIAGGDEDWVAVVPRALENEWIGWMQEGSEFGCCMIRSYWPTWLPHHFVRIGQHS